MSDLVSNHDSIWLPGMSGAVPLYTRQVEQAITEYDPMLSLGKDKITGDWVILREGGPEDQPYFPVIGLGKELPSPDRIKAELYKRDTKKRGAAIVSEVMQAQDRRKREKQQQADDAGGVMAEALDWAARKNGWNHGTMNSKVFIPNYMSKKAVSV